MIQKLALPYLPKDNSVNDMIFMIETKINQLIDTVERLDVENRILKSQLTTIGTSFSLVKEMDGTYRILFQPPVYGSTYNITPLRCEYIDKIQKTLEEL